MDEIKWYVTADGELLSLEFPWGTRTILNRKETLALREALSAALLELAQPAE